MVPQLSLQFIVPRAQVSRTENREVWQTILHYGTVLHMYIFRVAKTAPHTKYFPFNIHSGPTAAPQLHRLFGTEQGLACQISSAYWRMVRSEEK